MMRTLKILSITALAVAVGGSSVERVRAFALSGFAWQSGPIFMQLQLGSSGGDLINGCPDWGCAAVRSMETWNYFLNRSQLVAVRDSNAPQGLSSGFTNVIFSDDIYGEPWDEGTLAVTISQFSPSSGITFEADVLFNTDISWNGYDGPTRVSQGDVVYDFQRVALHEFGHVLGLDHPDQAGQNVTAIMNSRVDDNDSIQLDDIRGAYALYLGNVSGASLPFPPRNDTLNFRVQLEAKYRNDLRRPVLASYADPEGSVVWTQEFLRYRMSECRVDQAVGRIFAQIQGLGVQPVCGVAGPNPQFPPRNETFGFRVALEDVYRDGLGRLPTPTAVDPEGDVVWITEYIRYRLSGCSNAEAIFRVFRQIDGLGVQPACS
jgi:hypothetical protein